MKKSLVIALALMLVLAFATSAMAAQVLIPVTDANNPQVYQGYKATTATGMSLPGIAGTASIVKGVYQNSKFVADGTTNYPYEIYLPNERNTNAYRIHSNYTKNTDACASCHSTHTALGANLLQWYSTYETCMACHDGTVTTTYDVQAGKIGTTNQPTFGGMFGSGGGSESSHNVTGAMSIAAAPGGSVVKETLKLGHDNQDRWTPEFGCESCHTPHGLGGNARLLHPDANYFATDRATKKGWFGMVDKGDGKGYVVDSTKSGITFNTYGTDSVTGKAYFAYVEPAGTVGAGVYNTGNGLYILTGYPYSTIIKIAGVNISAAYRTDFKIDNTLGYSRVIYTGPDASVNDASYASNVVVIGVPSVKVTMTISNYLGFADTLELTASKTETVAHKDGMNVFCGTCHTDYNTMSDENWVADPITGAMKFSKSDKIATGVYSKAHRHQMGFNWYTATGGLKFETGYRMECLTCHVAHGTSTDYWNRTLVTNVGGPVKGPDGTAWTAGDLTELAGSSALKRMPNMGTCEACHAMENGNQGYAANTGAGVGATANVSNGLMPNTYNYMARDWNYDPTDLGWVGSAKCLGCHKEYVEGWAASGHATSSHTGAGSCGQCHDPGNAIMGSHTGQNLPTTYTAANQADALAWLATRPFETAKVAGNGTTIADTSYLGSDVGITCESCHGSGKNHILAPTSKNIFNPGTTDIKRQAMECGRCHDMYANVTYAKDGRTLVTNWTDSLGTLSTLSGMASVPTAIYKMSTIADGTTVPNFSVAYRVYGENPNNFADATQKTAVSTHFGGAWGYADSKHFLGTATTAANANGVVSCNTCHDMHSDKNKGLLKFSYEQVCASCHDASANLAQAAAMPTNSWSRHQLEFRDFAHSFKFANATTAPATIASVSVTAINLEKGILGKPGTSNGGEFYTVYDGAYGTPTVDYDLAAVTGGNLKTRSKTFGNWNLFRGGNAGGGIGMQVLASDGSGRVYNNYEMTWELDSTPGTATVANGSLIFEEGVGAIEFVNPYGTYTNSPGKDGAADYANNGAAYAKFAGVYTVRYTSKANPAVTGTVSFTVKNGSPTGTGFGADWHSN